MEDKKTVAKPEATTTKSGYVSRTALTTAEINALPRVAIKVTKQIIRSTGSSVYSLFHTLITNKNQLESDGKTIKVDSNGNPLFESHTIQYSNRDFTSTKFELFKEINALPNQNEYVIKVPFRAVKGKTNEGVEYFFYELFLGGRMIISDFYSNEDIELLKRRKGIKDIKFMVNDAVNSLEDITAGVYKELELVSSDIL